MWGWIEQASNQAKELVHQAQEAATEISKQAIEIQKNYDAEIQRSILLAQEQEQQNRKDQVQEKSGAPIRVEDLDFTYVTENLIGMGFPYEPKLRKNGKGNSIDDIADYLNSTHRGHYMIWNISEESYTYSKFSDQVCD
jgi:hypothetical protein